MFRKAISAGVVFGMLALTASAQQPGQPPTPPAVPGQPGQPPKAPAAPGQPGQPPTPPPPPGQPDQPLKTPGQPLETPSVPGQPGGQPPKAPRAPAAKADPMDALVQAALAHDVDVKLAQAKLQVADAELAKARQSVVMKVATLNASIQRAKANVERWSAELTGREKLANTGAVPITVVAEARAQLQQARDELAKAELEMKLLTGPISKEIGVKIEVIPRENVEVVLRKVQDALEEQHRDAAIKALLYLKSRDETPLAKGPIPERIRAALDKPVKLGPKGTQVSFEKGRSKYSKRRRVWMCPSESCTRSIPLSARERNCRWGHGSSCSPTARCAITVRLVPVPDSLSANMACW